MDWAATVLLQTRVGSAPSPGVGGQEGRQRARTSSSSSCSCSARSMARTARHASYSSSSLGGTQSSRLPSSSASSGPRTDLRCRVRYGLGARPVGSGVDVASERVDRTDWARVLRCVAGVRWVSGTRLVLRTGVLVGGESSPLRFTRLRGGMVGWIRIVSSRTRHDAVKINVPR